MLLLLPTTHLAVCIIWVSWPFHSLPFSLLCIYCTLPLSIEMAQKSARAHTHTLKRADSVRCVANALVVFHSVFSSATLAALVFSFGFTKQITSAIDFETLNIFVCARPLAHRCRIERCDARALVFRASEHGHLSVAHFDGEPTDHLAASEMQNTRTKCSPTRHLAQRDDCCEQFDTMSIRMFFAHVYFVIQRSSHNVAIQKYRNIKHVSELAYFTQPTSQDRCRIISAVFPRFSIYSHFRFFVRSCSVRAIFPSAHFKRAAKSAPIFRATSSRPSVDGVQHSFAYVTFYFIPFDSVGLAGARCSHSASP